MGMGGGGGDGKNLVANPLKRSSGYPFGQLPSDVPQFGIVPSFM